MSYTCEGTLWILSKTFLKLGSNCLINANVLILFLLSSALLSCKGSASDPFVSQKLGTVTESQSTSLSSDSVARNVVLLRVGRVSDPVVSVDKHSVKVQEGPAVKWESLTFKSPDSISVKKLYTELNGDKACAAKVPELQDILDLYPSMIPICDKNSILMLEKATSLTVSTIGNGDHEFSSWGINLQDLGGTSILIYSIFL